MSETMENLSIPISITRSRFGHINSRKIIQIACMSGADSFSMIKSGNPAEQLLVALVEDDSESLGASIFVFNRKWHKVPAIDLNCEEITLS